MSVVLVEGREGLMIKSKATKNRISWGRVIKLIKERDNIPSSYRYVPMALKRNFLNNPLVHTLNKGKTRYRTLRKVKGEK